MSGPVGIVNHLSIFAKIGFKKLLWFVVFINNGNTGELEYAEAISTSR